MGRQGRRGKQQLNDLQETRKLEKDRTFWRNHFGKGYRPIIRQTWWQWSRSVVTSVCRIEWNENSYSVPKKTGMMDRKICKMQLGVSMNIYHTQKKVPWQ